MRTLRTRSSLMLCMSRSMPPLGLVTKSMAPSSRAFRVLEAPSLLSELTTTIGRGLLVMLISMVMTSGLRDSERAMASRPSLARPTTWSWLSALKMDSRTLHMKAESSTTRTRNFFGAALTMELANRHGRTCRLRSNQLFDGSEELIFLNWFGEEGGGPFFQGAIAMLCASAGSND